MCSDEYDTLVVELGDYFKFATEGLDIASERRDVAVIEVWSTFETRNVCLVDSGLPSDVDLRPSDRIPNASESQANAPFRPKPSPKHTYRLGLRRSILMRMLTHLAPPIS